MAVKKNSNVKTKTAQAVKPIEKTAAPVKEAEMAKVAPVKAAPAKETVKETVKAEAVKTEAVKAEAVKEPAKKAPAKKAAAKKPAAKKAELKVSTTLQFDGKAYTEEELVKIAKDVWRYDLKRKLNELESIELYVKPEENVAYYVINKTETGSFNI